MANQFSTVKIAPATHGTSKFDMSHYHMTTTDFGQISIVNFVDCFIGDKLKQDFRLFSRFAPFVFPTYGDIKMRVLSIFVPYYIISDFAESYIAGIPIHSGRKVTGLYLQIGDLAKIFYGSLLTTPYDDGPTVSDYLQKYEPDEDASDEDLLKSSQIFVLHRYKRSAPATRSTEYFRPTPTGKYLYKIFRQLGYDVPHEVTMTNVTSGTPSSANWSKKINAYPIICYLKAYADLMLPSSLFQTSNLVSFLAYVKSHNGTYVNADGFVAYSYLNTVLKECLRVYYDSDYFTSAWQSPTSPLTSVKAANNLNTDVGDFSLEVGSTALPESFPSTTIENNTLSQQQLRWLRSFDNYVRRNNLVGYREFNAIYARFGIKPSEMKANYSQLIDIRNIGMNVGDVTATAETDQVQLGGYAGKGVMSGGGSINLDCKDFGCFIQIAYPAVHPIYFQGIRKHCLRVDGYDYFQPEFDGVGPEPISKIELNSELPDGVFGFTERYNSYRFALSNVTGDFATDPQLYAWHTGRVFDSVPTLVAQTNNMLSYVTDTDGNSEYDRVFATRSTSNYPLDHFFQQWEFHQSMIRNMKNINQAFDLGVGHVQLDKNGSV